MRSHIAAVVRRSRALDFLFQDCIECGVIFGMPDDLDNARRHDGQRYYCPNGHGQSYTETETARLTRELREARNDLAAVRSNLAKERGAAARLRERVKNGVCPVPECRRTVQALARHMKSQHPDYPLGEPE